MTDHPKATSDRSEIEAETRPLGLESVYDVLEPRTGTGSTTGSRVASFRLSHEAHSLLYKQAAAAGISTRAWLEQAILENKTEIVAVARPHSDLKSLMFYAGKSSNNLNQVAHHFNLQRMQGKISSATCEQALRILKSLESAFVAAVAHARSR